MSEQGCEQLTLFPADSPASRSAAPGSAEARKTTVTSGLKCFELSRNCGPLGLLEKMLLGSSNWASTRRFLTWKASATPQGRLYCAVDAPHRRDRCAIVGCADGKRGQKFKSAAIAGEAESTGRPSDAATDVRDALCGRRYRDLRRRQWAELTDGRWRPAEPGMGRVANGVPHRVDRIRCLGNAVVPQQFYPVFAAIAEVERMM